VRKSAATYVKSKIFKFNYGVQYSEESENKNYFRILFILYNITTICTDSELFTMYVFYNYVNIMMICAYCSGMFSNEFSNEI